METVKVAVRIRPLVTSEIDRGCLDAISRVLGQPQIVLNNEPFTFNYVFDSTDSQKLVFEDSISPIILKLYEGFNVTILAYGQTGSGKTYTMGTAFNGILDENAGVIPRAMNAIFDKINELSEECTFEVNCSFLELYQEQLYDLLSDKSREQSTVEVREDKNGIHIPDLTYETVKTAKETTDCLMRGSTGRAVGSTAMNEQSSRSHAIFTVTLQFTKNDASQTVTTSKFHLVDLAGSERSKKTQATGERFKEGVKINHGLLALGNVISALGSEKGNGFVRYRDSKLTRLLQDSLGGNSYTLMIACVSPADYNVQETLSTLRYADRARKIKNKPIVNQDPHAAEINQLKGVIQKLRLELLAASTGSNSSIETMQSTTISSPRKTYNNKMYRDLQEKYRNLQQQFQKTLHDVVENEMRAHIAEAAHEKLKIKTEELKLFAKTLFNDIEKESTLGENEKLSVKVRQMVEMVFSLDEELEKTVSEMNDHRQQCNLNTTASDDENELGEDGVAEIEKEADDYNNKQFKFKEELVRINRDLNVKEQLQQRLADNLTKFCTIETSSTGKFEECQRKIRDLEVEKSELLDKLNHVKENATAKLAEDRRKRLQLLEHELSDLKSKIKQQSSLLKVREKEKLKVQNLSSEIQAMKESKVRLIRSMRQEAENFRQWKLTREKELMQMKNKGRKMENEMARKEALHTKQRNVLKRKCEEALAINKRLKDALERQSAAQSQRHKTQSAKDNNTKRIEQVVALVEQELEVITSIIDAEQTLEHLMEDRSIINRRIKELRKIQPESAELIQLKEEYEMRNAQITELQQKVCAADLETRIRALCDTAQNMNEARAILKHLSSAICDMRRENLTRLQEQKTALDEQRTRRQSAEQECEVAVKRIKTMEKEHMEEIVQRDRAYEEKVAFLLNELSAAPKNLDDELESKLTPEQLERLKIQRELFDKMESMREEIENYKQIIEDVKKSKKPKAKQQQQQMKRESCDVDESESEVIDCLSSSEDVEDMGSDMDPDWHLTPAPPKRRKKQSRSTTSSIAEDLNPTTTTTATDSFSTAISAPAIDVKKACRCRTGCKSKRCSCRLDGSQCSSRCRCGVKCSNKVANQNNEHHDADDEVDQNDLVTQTNGSTFTKVNDSKENVDEVNENEQENFDNGQFLDPNAIPCTPKVTLDEKSRRLARLTEINFETPTSKKKFFD